MHLTSTVKNKTCVSAPISLKRETLGVGDVYKSMVRHPQPWCLKDLQRRASIAPQSVIYKEHHTTLANWLVKDGAREGKIRLIAAVC